MEKSTEEKVNQALDYIRNDRMMAADPYFTARLMARSGHYFADPGYAASSRGLFLKLRPALAAVLVLAGVSAGILLGSGLTGVNTEQTVSERTALMEQYAEDHAFAEINGTFEEQLLSNQ